MTIISLCVATLDEICTLPSSWGRSCSKSSRTEDPPVFKYASIKPYKWNARLFAFAGAALRQKNTSLCKTKDAKRIQKDPKGSWLKRSQSTTSWMSKSSSKVRGNFCEFCASFWQVFSRHKSGIRDQILCPGQLHDSRETRTWNSLRCLRKAFKNLQLFLSWLQCVAK